MAMNLKSACARASVGNWLAVLLISCCKAAVKPSMLQSHVVGSIRDVLGLLVLEEGLFHGHCRLLPKEEGECRFPSPQLRSRRV